MPVLARIDKNNRTTVPHEVRKLLEVGNGNTIEWVYEDDHVYVRKAGR